MLTSFASLAGCVYESVFGILDLRLGVTQWDCFPRSSFSVIVFLSSFIRLQFETYLTFSSTLWLSKLRMGRKFCRSIEIFKLLRDLLKKVLDKSKGKVTALALLNIISISQLLFIIDSCRVKF